MAPDKVNKAIDEQVEKVIGPRYVLHVVKIEKNPYKEDQLKDINSAGYYGGHSPSSDMERTMHKRGVGQNERVVDVLDVELTKDEFQYIKKAVIEVIE